MSEVFKKDRYTILDGAMGTMLQKSGLELGRQPDVLGIEQPEIVERIGRMYVESGSDWICANTFGANRKNFRAADIQLSRSSLLPSAVPNLHAGEVNAGFCWM